MKQKDKRRVIFICRHNSARSQMAEGFMRAMYGDRFDVYSAGLEPSEIRKEAIRVMSEIGIDISSHRAKSIDEFKGMEFDLVVTVCQGAREACPFVPVGRRYLHKEFYDPSELKGTEEEILDGFRRIRDEIKDWVKSQDF